MREDYRALLKPEIINSVSGLALISRVIVDGYLSGLNNSRRVGAGLEFSQYRGYEPGDDLRLLDWKMLARSGRYYIKQADIDTHIRVKFVIDASASMLHQEDGLSKMDIAKVLTAALAHLSHGQGDAVGLAAINESRIEELQPQVSKQHFKRFLYSLSTIQNIGKWPQDIASERLHNRADRELLFFITDLYEQESELTAMISQLKTARNEVVVLHLVGKSELHFEYKGQVIFEDLETGEKRKVNAAEARELYLTSFDKAMETIKNMLFSKGISYERFQLDVHLGEALQVFLKKRAKLL